MNLSPKLNHHNDYIQHTISTQTLLLHNNVTPNDVIDNDITNDDVIMTCYHHYLQSAGPHIIPSSLYYSSALILPPLYYAV